VAVLTHVKVLRILACTTLAVVLLAVACSHAIAQPTACCILPSGECRSQDPEPVAPNRSASTTTADGTDRAAPSVGGSGSTRMFGVLPNYATVEGPTEVPPISASLKFKLAALNTFDPYVYPFVGAVAATNRDFGADGVGYLKQYAVSLTDNSLGNLLTSAVLPSVLHQDPRYFERGSGGLLRRLAYAASRSVVTRGDSGHAQFNVSEIGGNAIAAGLSDMYYPATERTVAATFSRWGMQVMWDTLSNELKEFWPDVRRMLHRE
jgi:hypothetical protein